MKRVAFIADSHFSERSRWEECTRLHQWIEGDIAERGVDLICHCGDVFDAKSTPQERLVVAEWFQDLATHAPVVVVRGNHDALGDLEILGKLKSRHEIIVQEAANVHVVAGCAVLALAWPRKSEVLAKLTAEQAAAGGEIAKDALRNVIRGFGAQVAEFDGPRIMVTHAMVGGSVTSTGQPLVGFDFELGLDELAASNAHFVAVGHIHKGQSWEYQGVPIVYPGSPRRTAFGEAEAKGYVIANLEHFDGELTCEESPGVRWYCEGWEFIEAPATPMLLAEWHWAPEHIGLPGDVVVPAGFVSMEEERFDDPKGAEIRLRYWVDSDQRAQAKTAAEEVRSRLLSLGAVSVKLEEVVETSTRARTPEIVAARTLTDKLRVLWRAKGIKLGDREPSVLSKLNELEASV